MPIDLTQFETGAQDAVKLFWGNRSAAVEQQQVLGSIDTGTRGAVTSGKNMDGFATLMAKLVEDNGLPSSTVEYSSRLVTLPGFFRPTKQWDLLVVNEGRLIAALEFKSQVGSFGNNFNNRTEEAIGTAHDLWTAYREGAFGEHPKPFVGWLMLLEDAPGSRRPVKDRSPHFPVFSDFQDSSYADRYNHLCKKLAQENLYTAATIMLSPQSAGQTGEYTNMSELTSLQTFITTFAGHIAAEAARI